ncbi:MAG: FtsQ-type POTRA domain-containing protein [Candidatus Moraniibacteriota bacterium]
MIKEKNQHWAKERKDRKSISRVGRFLRPVLIYYFLVLFFMGVIIYSFVFSDFLEINNIKISGVVTISQTELEKSIREEMAGKYLKIIPADNLILFDGQKVSKTLKSKFKKIKKITLNKKFPNTLSVEIEERSLILTLCSRGNCYFIDENGYAYEKVDLASEEVRQNKIIKLIDESGKEIYEGGYVLMPSYVDFVTSIAREIEANTSLEILDEYRTRSRISGEVIVQTAKGWDIYFNDKISIAKSVYTLKVLLNRQLMLRDLNELEYIDLRSENKVFYRMIGGVTQEEEGAKEEAEAASESENNEASTAVEKEKEKDKD